MFTGMPSVGGKLLVQPFRTLSLLCRKSYRTRQRNLLCSGELSSLRDYLYGNDKCSSAWNIVDSTSCIKKSFHSCVHSAAYENSHYWDYSEKYGPGNWNKVWKTTMLQSPVDIVTKSVKYDESLKPFTFDKTPVILKYGNNGVNAGITPDDGNQILLNGGALKNAFEFMQFHFHFGEENTCGCEHTVDGHRYAAELHIVHYNKALYSDKAEAFSGANGLAVLGIFLDASEHYDDNPNLAFILRAFDNILYEGQSYTATDAYSVYDMLPSNCADYFTYPGSLTTPPLTENVTWTVFAEPIRISKKQQKEFTKLCAVHHDNKNKICSHDPCVRSSSCIPQPPNICNNYRPVQPLHNRIIHSSFQV